jgi:hypothetical protein
MGNPFAPGPSSGMLPAPPSLPGGTVPIGEGSRGPYPPPSNRSQPPSTTIPSPSNPFTAPSPMAPTTPPPLSPWSLEHPPYDDPGAPGPSGPGD